MNHSNQPPRTTRFFEWISRHTRPIVAITVLAALTLGGLFAVVADTSESQFDPEGEIYTLQEKADTTLVSESTIGNATFLVEAADGGDVLTAHAFREWHLASERVRANHDGHLVDRFDPDVGSTVPGVISVVDLVADSLPNGLTDATDADVKVALAAVLSDDSATADLRFTLSEQATATTNPDGTIVWTSPAFTTSVVYDEAGFEDEVATEVWLRSVQEDFRQGATVTHPIGVAIDFNTTLEEAAMASAPFIFLAVSLIVLLIAVVHRSFWSAALVASGLGVTMLTYNGIAALAGLKMGSLLLSFIVPIALISFGVDFYIHGSGRVREMQVEGLDRRSAYPVGMTAVFTAMLLAVSTSVAAFLANAFAGTEAIVEFGIAAAIGLIVAYVVLGIIAPCVLLAIEQTVGPNKVAGKARWAYRATIVANGDRGRARGDPGCARTRHRGWRGRGDVDHRRGDTGGADPPPQPQGHCVGTPGRRDHPRDGSRVERGRQRRPRSRQMADDHDSCGDRPRCARPSRSDAGGLGIRGARLGLVPHQLGPVPRPGQRALPIERRGFGNRLHRR